MRKTVNVLPEWACVETRTNARRKEAFRQKRRSLGILERQRDAATPALVWSAVRLIFLTPVIAFFVYLEGFMFETAWPTVFIIAGFTAFFTAHWIWAFKSCRQAIDDLRNPSASRRLTCRPEKRIPRSIETRLQIAVLLAFSGGCVFATWVGVKALMVGLWPGTVFFGFWAVCGIAIVGYLLSNSESISQLLHIR